MNLFPLLTFVPKNYFSFLVGRIARWEKPRFFVNFLIILFVKKFKPDLGELEKPIEEFKSLNELFTRNIISSAREIQAGLISPVDGKITEFGEIKAGQLIQVKGTTYSVEDFLVDKELAKEFQDGFFITIYLAPYNYHHIHAPFDGEIIESIYVPGTLWPVNSWSVNNIKNLFVVNERIVSVLKIADDNKVAVTKIGATSVGSISVTYDDIISNVKFPTMFRKTSIKHYDTLFHYKKGQKLGSFNFGSTVVLLMQKKFYPKYGLVNGQEIRMGERLGDYN